MDIVCCTDRAYLKYCITMLLSLLDNNKGENMCIHLLANGLGGDDVDKVRRVVLGGNA